MTSEANPSDAVVASELQEPLLQTTASETADPGEPDLGSANIGESDVVGQSGALTAVQEPAEANNNPWTRLSAHGLRALHAPAPPEPHPTRWRTCGLRIVGGGLATAGLGILAWQFIPWAAIYDFITTHAWALSGVGLSAAGLGILLASRASAAKHESGLAWDSGVAQPVEEPVQQFTLTLWNDTARFGADVEALQKLLGAEESAASGGRGNVWPIDLQEAAERAEQADLQRFSEEYTTRKKQLLEECKSELESGKLSAHRLRQKLRPRCFVIDFSDGEEGGMLGTGGGGLPSEITRLRDAVSFLLAVSSPYDEVVLRLSSPGGRASDYGLASSQLLRLRSGGVKLTACVDVVAASGGYMMACVAEKVLAAPFAILGSIGVIASLPNFHRVLEKNDVDYLLFTAGKYKSPVNVLARNSEEGLAKFQGDLEAIHKQFAGHVALMRGSAIGDVDSVATGEVFLAQESLEKGLIDGICTSDEYLRSRTAAGIDVIVVGAATPQKTWLTKLFGGFTGLASAIPGVLGLLTSPLTSMLRTAPHTNAEGLLRCEAASLVSRPRF